MVPHLRHAELIVVLVTACVEGHRVKRENNLFTCLQKRLLVCLSVCLSVYPLVWLNLNLHLQASAPSNHMCSMFLLPGPPQFLYQAPPGAQQLGLPDFSNVPHFGHSILLVETIASVFALTQWRLARGLLTPAQELGQELGQE